MQQDGKRSCTAIIPSYVYCVVKISIQIMVPWKVNILEILQGGVSNAKRFKGGWVDSNQKISEQHIRVI